MRKFTTSMVLLALSACSGAPEKPAEGPSTAAPSEPASEEPAPAADTAETDEATETSGDSAGGEAVASQSDPATAQRELKYVQTPQGLEIDVVGVKFLATATAIKSGGGWGVRVKTTANAKDGKSHQILTPKRGPLAFAGAVERGGQAQRFGDKREGDEVRTVDTSQVEFSRDWPGDTGEKPLKAGESLALEVGLWGIGESAEDRRPVKQFFLVKVSAGKGKPQAVVLPPEKFQSAQ